MKEWVLDQEENKSLVKKENLVKTENLVEKEKLVEALSFGPVRKE